MPFYAALYCKRCAIVKIKKLYGHVQLFNNIHFDYKYDLFCKRRDKLPCALLLRIVKDFLGRSAFGNYASVHE